MSRALGQVSPLAPIGSAEQARHLSRLTAYGFWISSGVSLIQAVGVWYGASAEFEAFRGSTTGFSVVLALVTAGLGLWQWRKPNRMLPIFGIAWALYELSAFVTSALVGAPLGAQGVPVWSPYMSSAAMLVCLILHVGGLRGAAALAKMT